MSKITEVAKGLKAAVCELRNDEFIKGYNHSSVITAAAILAGFVVSNMATTVAIYIHNKQ